MKRAIGVALFVGLTMVTLSCGKKKDGVDNAAEAAKYEVKYPEVMKNWVSRDCIKSKVLLISPVHYKIEYDFYGDAFVKRLNYYNDGNCTDQIARVTYKGNVTITEPNDDGLGSRAIDLLYTGVSVGAVTESGKKFLQTVDLCGQKNFPVGQDVDMTEASAKPTCVLQTSNKVTYYDRFVVSDGILRLGTGYSEKPMNDKLDERAGVQNDEHFTVR